MNKMAEKVVAVMNEQEIDALIDDHYIGEAQTLTQGAEENILKLAEIRNRMTPEQQKRWQEIKKGFMRVKSLGGAETDPVTRVVSQLNSLSDGLAGISTSIKGSSTIGDNLVQIAKNLERAGIRDQEREKLEQNQVMIMASYLKKLHATLEHLTRANFDVHVVNQPLPGLDTVLNQMVNVLEGALIPIAEAINRQLNSDHAVWERLGEVAEVIKDLERKGILKAEKTTKTIAPFAPRSAKTAQPDLPPPLLPPEKKR